MKNNLKYTPIIIALLAVTLTLGGVYGSFIYIMDGPINGDSEKINPSINEFEYPEWTVNFYSFGKGRNLASGGYAGYPDLVSTFTYYNKKDTFTFPSTIGPDWSENHTLKAWTPRRFYVEGEYDVYSNDDSFTKGTMYNINGKTYEPGGTYKVDDIEWGSDNTLNLYELSENMYYNVGHTAEFYPSVSCSGIISHTASSFTHTFDLPYSHIVVYDNYGGSETVSSAINDGISTFVIQYADKNNFASLPSSVKNVTPTLSTPAYGEKHNYRIVLPVPEMGVRVTEQNDRKGQYVDESSRTVNYFDFETIKIYVTPGTYFKADIPAKYFTDTLSNGDQWKHMTWAETIINEDYNEGYKLNHASLRCTGLHEGETSYNGTIPYDICTVQTRMSPNYHSSHEKIKDGNESGGSSGGGNTCLLEGTKVLKADGSYVSIENINSGDMLMSFNHDTAQFEAQPVLAVAHKEEEAKHIDVTRLNFSDGREIKISNNHAFYDLTLEKYAIIDKDNVSDYIGHKFFTYENKEVTLISAITYKDTVKVYVPFTKGNINCIANGLLTNPGVYAKFLINIFEFEDDMQINQDKKNTDIDKYGLFTYEDFKDLVPKNMFEKLKLGHLKIGLAKELYSIEEVITNLNIYKRYF